ncbi:MAG: hypothetical protein AB1631_16015 [Acidobacteriota bacterium]
MRQLEDELRKAFRREEPSPDFADRVMERVRAQSPPVKTAGWQRFFPAFETPRVRWAAIGAAALLLIVIGVIGYQKSRQSEDQQANIKQGTLAPEQQKQKGIEPTENVSPEKIAPDDKKPQPRVINHKPKARINQDRLIASREERREGLEAKRKLLLALQVTSFTLNEAQRIVREDRAGRE